MMPARRRATPVVITSERSVAIQDVALDFPLDRAELRSLVQRALEEDAAFKDVTTAATVVSNRRARATLMAREKGVLAGAPLALEAFRLMDPKVAIRVDMEDGAQLKAASAIFFLSGHARAILSAERVALNFLQRLSGIATLTARFVEAVAGTGVRIMDTRKTTPGWRALEKYAVRAGGGVNHRSDLASAVLIKDNHLVALDGNIGYAIKRARKLVGNGMTVEVECETPDQVAAAVDAGADVVLLDNMSLKDLRASVKAANGRAVLEASGGIKLQNVRSVAETGVDCISVGALTHSAPALDLALEFDPG